LSAEPGAGQHHIDQLKAETASDKRDVLLKLLAEEAAKQVKAST
jgi:hypothetical protein